jgi:alcohol dehydrogenase class IV
MSPSPPSPSHEIVAIGLRHVSGPIKVLRDEYDHQGAETETSSAFGERMDHLARFLDLPGGGFDAVLTWVLDLRNSLGIAHSSSALGVIAEEIPLLARMGAEDPTAGTNPVALTPENLTSLFEQSLRGEVVVL